MPITDRDIDIICAMIDRGGSFASALGEAANRADAHNLAKIKAAFPELWTYYGQFARQANAAEAADEQIDAPAKQTGGQG